MATYVKLIKQLFALEPPYGSLIGKIRMRNYRDEGVSGRKVLKTAKKREEMKERQLRTREIDRYR